MEAKTRKINYSREEIVRLLEEISVEKDILMSSFSMNRSTKKKKDETWSKIATSVSAIGIAVRTAKEIKDKWFDVKKDFIKRQHKEKGTGGGPEVPTKPYDGLIMEIIGENSATVEGIDGGTDTWCMMEESMHSTQSIEEDSAFLHCVELPLMSPTSMARCDRRHGPTFSLPSPNGAMQVHSIEVLQGDLSHCTDTGSTPEAELVDTTVMGAKQSSFLGRKKGPLKRKAIRKERHQTVEEAEEKKVYMDYMHSQIQKNKSLRDVHQSIVSTNRAITKVAELKARKLQLEIEQLESEKTKSKVYLV